MATKTPSKNVASCVGVEASGPDPTFNVIALSEAANKRQDDLRELNNKRIEADIARLDAQIASLKEMDDLRADSVKEIANLRAEHTKEIGILESSRLNAIRQVDVLAANTAAASALAAIQTLAATTATNAENIRTAMGNTAITIAKQLSDTVNQITERIGNLEKMSYTGMGKQAVEDPMMTQLREEVKQARASLATGTGKSEGKNQMWGYIVGGIGMVVGVMGILAFVRGVR